MCVHSASELKPVGITKYCGDNTSTDLSRREWVELRSKISDYLYYEVSSQSEREKIWNWVSVLGFEYIRPDYKEAHAFDQAFCSEGSVPLVTKEGKLVKRISKYMRKCFGYKLTDEDMSKIGQLIKSYTAEEFFYDITDRFDWNAGDFGDRGSCFWADRSAAKEIMQEYGALAFRLWRGPNPSDGGSGRSWLMPYPRALYGGEPPQGWIMFNAYGHQLGKQVEMFKMALGAKQAKGIELDNWGSSTDVLYINNDRGYLFTWSDEPITITHHDFEAGDGVDYTACQECGRRIDRDTCCIYEGNWDVEYYCDDCFSDLFSYCEACERDYPQDYVTLVTVYDSWRARHRPTLSPYVDRSLCDSCRGELVECEGCRSYVEPGDAVEDDHCEYRFCPVCADEYLRTCDRCDLTLHRDDVTYDKERDEDLCCECEQELQREQDELQPRLVEVE